MKKQRLYATTKLKEERESRGYTQSEMAQFLSLELGLNISHSVYQKYEQGERAIGGDKIIAMCSYFGIKQDELVKPK